VFDNNNSSRFFRHTYLLYIPPNQQLNQRKIIEILNQMGEYDQYKHWIDRNVVEFEVAEPTEADLGQIKLRASAYSYPELGDTREAMSQLPGRCQLVNLMIATANNDYFRHVSPAKLVEQFRAVGVDAKLGVSTDELIRMIKKFYTTTISVKAFNPLGQLVRSYLANNIKCCLQYVINDRHCYPIVESSVKNSVGKTNQIKFTDIDPHYNFENSIFLLTKYQGLVASRVT
jgi:hypothetical protein